MIMIGALVAVTVGGLVGCGASSRGGSSAAAGLAGGKTPAQPARASSDQGAAGSTASAGGSGGAGTAVAANGTLGAPVTAAKADIVETGTVDLLVADGADLRNAFARLTNLAGDDGGFVASSSMQTGKHPSAAVTLRILEADASAAMNTISAGPFGKVTSKTSNGQNVTGQVVDLGVEIANLTSEEKAVRVLLDKAVSVRDILTIQQQLFVLQGEVQQLQAQSNSLDNRVTYATVTVNLTTQAPPAVVTVAHRSTLARFWHLAASHSVDAVRGIVLAVGWAAPILIAAGLVAGGWLMWRRRRRDPAAGSPTPAGPAA